jgi:uncharacterized protein YidB (DUF937 family)
MVAPGSVARKLALLALKGCGEVDFQRTDNATAGYKSVVAGTNSVARYCSGQDEGNRHGSRIPINDRPLGPSAIAGYQNRDKLAELFREAQAKYGASGPGGSQEGRAGTIGNLGGILSGTSVGGLLRGGLRDLVESFRLSRQELLSRLLLEAVDKYTPEGRLPAPA